MLPASVEHVILPVVIAEHELVNGLCAIDDVVNQWLAQGIHIGTLGLVGYGYADTAHLALVHVIGTEEEVEFVVRLNDGRSP